MTQRQYTQGFAGGTGMGQQFGGGTGQQTGATGQRLQDVESPQQREAVQAIARAIQVTEWCAAQCIQLGDANMSECIRRCEDVSELGETALTLIPRQSRRAQQVLQAFQQAAQDCQQECSQHGHAHCQECAQVVGQAAQTVQQYLGGGQMGGQFQQSGQAGQFGGQTGGQQTGGQQMGGQQMGGQQFGGQQPQSSGGWY